MKHSREPIAASVIRQKFESRTSAITKDEDAARHGIFVEFVPTDRGERIDASPEINGLAGKENPELRNELNHRSCEFRKSEQSAEIKVWFRFGSEIESLAPSGRSSRSRQSPGDCGSD
jgi:hypothetical protein